MRSLKTTGPNLRRDEVCAAHTTAVAAVRRLPEQALLLADNCRAERLNTAERRDVSLMDIQNGCLLPPRTSLLRLGDAAQLPQQPCSQHRWMDGRSSDPQEWHLGNSELMNLGLFDLSEGEAKLWLMGRGGPGLFIC